MSTENKELTNEAPIVEDNESSIDFKKLWEDVKKHKKLYYKVLPIAFIVAAIYAISLPSTYVCRVVLAPEMSSSARRNMMMSSASSYFLNLGMTMENTEAIMPSLYPEVIQSVPFQTSLFNLKVHRKNSSKEMTYFDYLLKDQRSPWWSKAIGAVFSLIPSSSAPKDTIDESKVNPFELTRKQSLVCKMIGGRIFCDVDKKTFIITIDVADQDPLIAATIADSVQAKLQKYMTDYRTNKARIDMEYYNQLTADAKDRYEKALVRYSTFSDHNQKASLPSVRSEQTKLENELTLQQRLYAQAVSQQQAAEARLQEDTPAFATIENATVPLTRSAPARSKMCLIFTFFAFICTTVYIFHKEKDLLPMLGIGGKEEA